MLELRARCATVKHADLPEDSREDALVVAEAVLSFEQVVRDVPQNADALESLRQHAHNMLNPLSAVIGFSQYMRDATGHPDTAAVYRAANETLFTIDSLVFYARAKAYTLAAPAPLHATTFDLVRLPDKVAQQASLEIALAEGEIIITADRNQMEQVMMALAQTANNIATDTAQLSLQPDTDDHIHLTFRFPSAVAVTSLAAKFHPEWLAVPGEVAVWEMGLCGIMPIVEGHRGSFEIVAVGHEVQFALALPTNVNDAINSRPM